MELVNVMFGEFASAGPDEGASIVVDFEHMLFGFWPRVPEHPHEHHRHVAHEVDGVIVDDDVPRGGEFLFGNRLIDLDNARLSRFERLSHTGSNISDGVGFTNFGLICGSDRPICVWTMRA